MRKSCFLVFLTPLALLACEDAPAVRSSLFTQAGDSGADGVMPEGGIRDVSADVDPGPGVCNEMFTWGAPKLVPDLSTADSDSFGAITEDELTIAWMVNSGSVLYADRTASTAPFGAPKTFSDPAVALERVALSSDGLKLIFVKTGNTSFAEVSRTSRTADFTGPFDAAPYQSLVPLAEDAGPSAIRFADPVLSADGTLLYYTQFGLGQSATLSESYRTGSTPWPEGRVLTNPELIVTGTMFRRPTGISHDNRTLFFWDETTGTERAVFRKGLVPPFNDFNKFVDVGASFTRAAPNAACSRIYYSAPSTTAAGLDLFFSDAK